MTDLTSWKRLALTKINPINVITSNQITDHYFVIKFIDFKCTKNIPTETIMAASLGLEQRVKPSLASRCSMTLNKDVLNNLFQSLA